MPTYHYRHGFQRKSTKAEMQTGTALAAAAETTKPTFVPNTASVAHLNRTPAITAAIMANKSRANSHSTCSSKKLVFLSRYLTRRERLDVMESGLENLRNRALCTTLDEIHPHRIALKSNVILAGRALMSSQYLCGIERPDSVHIILEVLLRNIHGNMQRVKALIDCGATSIIISLTLLRKLELPHKPALTSTQGVNGHVMMSARQVSWFSNLNTLNRLTN
jgi:hypothetical protein